jgi:predicted PurR-regulated permease PerM
MAQPVEVGSKGSRLVVLASICVVIAALYFARQVFVPIALAVLLSFLLTPVVRWLERVGLPRAAAALIVVILALGIVGTIGYIVSRQFVSVLKELPKYQVELRGKVQALRSHGGVLTEARKELHAITATSQPSGGPSTRPAPADDKGAAGVGATPNAPADGHEPTTQPSPDNPLAVREYPAPPGPVEMIRNWATSLLDPLATAFLVVVFIIFMLLKREDLRDRMIRLIGHGRLNLTTQALDEAATRISRYLGALAIVNSCYGVVVAGGLWIIGHFLGHGIAFPNVLVWGLLVGIFRFVPYVGVWIGASVPLLLAFAIFPGSGPFFAALGLIVGMEVIVAQFVEPFWYGATTGMSALAVLVAAVFWTWLWGPIGLLLSTPLTVCLVVIGKYVPQMQFLDILLGDEPVLPVHARLYQRLIAFDEEEAGDLAHELRKDRSLEAVYDQAILPALAMAEQDHHRGRLDDQRLAFVQQNIHDIVEEMGEAERAGKNETPEAQKEEAGKDPNVEHAQVKAQITIPKDCAVRVLTLPAKSRSDEVVALMLSQLLDFRGYSATAGSVDSLASEMVGMVDKQRIDISCVSALPPAAIARARYLCKRIHAKLPEVQLLVGLWMHKGDIEKARPRLACADSKRLVTTLAQAQEQIDQMAQPLLIRDAVPAVTT